MNSISISRMTFILSAMLLVIAGCSTGDQPELGQVNGTVTLDGKPLAGVAVVFQPEQGRPARGQTNAEGKYELTYIRKTLGSKVGKNRIEIAPSEDGEVEEVEPTDADSQPSSSARPAKSNKPIVPPRYNIKSELEREVKPGKNTFDFDLTS